MEIIASLCSLYYGCASKDALTYHLMTPRLWDLSMSIRCRIPLVYMSTFISFLQLYSSGILTQVHRKSTAILISFLDFEVTNIIYVTVWWNAIA